jgi:hypothetical protein
MAAGLAIADHVEDSGVQERFPPAGKRDILPGGQPVHDGNELLPFHVLQFDAHDFAGTHMAIHVAPVGDFDLHLLRSRGDVVLQAVKCFFDQFQHMQIS